MSKKAQTVQGLKCLENRLFWLKSAIFADFLLLLPLNYVPNAPLGVCRRARLEHSALFFTSPFDILKLNIKIKYKMLPLSSVTVLGSDEVKKILKIILKISKNVLTILRKCSIV